jgi:hypothetical protein
MAAVFSAELVAHALQHGGQLALTEDPSSITPKDLGALDIFDPAIIVKQNRD